MNQHQHWSGQNARGGVVQARPIGVRPMMPMVQPRSLAPTPGSVASLGGIRAAMGSIAPRPIASSNASIVRPTVAPTLPATIPPAKRRRSTRARPDDANGPSKPSPRPIPGSSGAGGPAAPSPAPAVAGPSATPKVAAGPDYRVVAGDELAGPQDPALAQMGLIAAEQTPISRITLALASRVPDQVDWALTRLQAASYYFADKAMLYHLPHLLDALLETIGDYVNIREAVATRLGVQADLWLSLKDDPSVDIAKRRAIDAAAIIYNLATVAANMYVVKNNTCFLQTVTYFVREACRADDVTEISLYLLDVLEILGPRITLGQVVGDSLKVPVSDHSVKRLLELSSRWRGPLRPSTSSKGTLSSSKKSLLTLGPSEFPRTDVRDLFFFQLFPSLVALVTSSDRALVLASLRCLTQLAMNPANERVFNGQSFAVPSTAAGTPTSTHHESLFYRPIQLLSSSDSELVAASLEFMYQVCSMFPLRAVQFAARSDLPTVLRLVADKLHTGAQKDIVSFTVPVRGDVASTALENDWEKHVLDHKSPDQLAHLLLFEGRGGIPSLAKNPQPPPYDTDSVKLDPKSPDPRSETAKSLDRLKLPKHVAEKLVQIREPERASLWADIVFEHAKDAVLPQRVIWDAYVQQFEPNAARPHASLLPAADLLKLVANIHSTSVPMVVGNDEYIVKGIRIRDRPDLHVLFQCLWRDCPVESASRPLKARELFLHLKSHIDEQLSASLGSPPEGTIKVKPHVPLECKWSKCAFRSSSKTPAKELLLHILSHIPAWFASQGPPFSNISGVPPSEPPVTLAQQRYQHPDMHLDDSFQPKGANLFAALFLKLIASTVADALQHQQQLGVQNSTRGLEDISLIDLMSRSASGVPVQAPAFPDNRPAPPTNATHTAFPPVDTSPVVLKPVDYLPAVRGMNAILAIENRLLKSTTEDFALTLLVHIFHAIVLITGKQS